ncbi:MAG: hypothetical protein FWF90_05040 [Promicromonosporaceae bacterium]|nr:hypothetical protein [Promicromonosporaceae bacterium]
MTENQNTRSPFDAVQRGKFDRALSSSVDLLFASPDAASLLDEFLAGDRVMVIARDALACVTPQEAVELFTGKTAATTPTPQTDADAFRPGFYV